MAQVLETSGASGIKSKSCCAHGGHRESKKRGSHSRLVGGRFNIRETYLWGLFWVPQDKQISASTSPPVFQPFLEVLMGFSAVSCPDGLSNTLLSQGCILESAPGVRKVGGMYISRTWGGAWSLQLPRSSSRVNQRTHLLSDLLQQNHQEPKN